MALQERGVNRSGAWATRLRPDTLLPMVRAAMVRGEGPPAVLAWVRANGHPARQLHWNSLDEARARALAGRLAETLASPGSRADVRTAPLGETQDAELRASA